MLSSVRGITLASARLIQVLAREPWVGAAIFTVLVALVVWAGLSRSTLVGAIFPALVLLVAVIGYALFTVATGVLDLPMDRLSRWIGFAFMLGVPLAFGVVALVLHWADWSVPGWLDDHIGHAVTLAAGGAGLVAAALIVAPGVTPATAGKWRGTLIGVYRAVVSVTIAVVAIAALVQRWRHGPGGSWAVAANEHRGTILVLVLVTALLTAAAIESALARARRPRQ
jgi:hypothetical protein